MTDQAQTAVHQVADLLTHLFAGDLGRDRPFTEALFTTFNVDLGFFESRILGLVRSTGAAVTVVADASVWAPDPRAVKGAGAAYAVGLVDMTAAFHPKVSVLVGAERILLAVGSGNLTTGGWLNNDETITVVHGSLAEGVPALVVQAGTWLRSLAQLRTSRIAQDAIDRVATAIERLTEGAEITDTGHTLVSTSTGPVLEQLPTGQVEELRLHAPFHDPAGAALEALLARYRPRTVRIAVQPGKTVLEPDALHAVAAGAGARLVWQDAGTPYRHGKLIEAVGAGGRWTLTGSANITGAALLRAMTGGGNCEVGVLHRDGPDLYPGAGSAMDPAQVPATRIESAPGEGEAQAPTPRLLSASLEDGALHLELAGPTPVAADVEVSRFEALPEDFVSVGSVPQGATQASLTYADLQARARVRLAWTAHGIRNWTPMVFVNDPTSVLHRIAARTSTRTNADVDWSQLFGSHSLQNDWYRQIDTVMREQSTAVPLPRAGGTRTTAKVQLDGVDGWRTVDDPDVWAQYAQDAVERLGPTIAHHASGGVILPHLGRPTGTVSAPIWEDDFDASETDFDDERSAEDQDAEQEPAAPRTHAEPTAADKARTRRWLQKVTSDLDTRPAIDRCALVRLALIGTYMDVWDSDDEAWFEVLADAARHLPGTDTPAPLAPQVAALAAVCLHRLDQAAELDRRTGTGRTYVKVTRALREAVAHAQADRIEQLLREMFSDADLAPSTEAVVDHTIATLDPNPWPEVVRLVQLEHPDWNVELERDAVIYIEGSITNPLRAAAQVLTFAPGTATVAVNVQPVRGDEATVVRHADTLTLRSTTRGRTQWRTYRLTKLVGPLAIASSADSEQGARIDRPPWHEPSATAIAAFDAIGLAAAAPLGTSDVPKN